MDGYAIPSDWDINDPETWSLTTTVDACAGIHHTGAVMREYQEIRHAATDYESPAELERIGADAEQAQWWAGVLTPIHEAACALAEALPGEIEGAADRLGAHPRDDGSSTIWDAVSDADDLELAAREAERIMDALGAKESAG